MSMAQNLPEIGRLQNLGVKMDKNVYKNVTQHQLMRLFAVKLIVSYEPKCKVRSKFLKN